MAVAYLDAFSGISGDMTVGAFLGLGLPLDHLRAQLGQLRLEGYEIGASSRRIEGILAVKFDVHVSGEDPGRAHRSLADIRKMIQHSQLAAAVKDKALHRFARLAEAEGRVHGVAPETVTFHETGAIDSIIDVVGAAVGAEYFAVDRLFVSPLPGGSGVLKCRHGVLPVPAPAVAELLKGFRLHVGEGTGELVTPTGAALVAALADTAEPPPLRLAAVGYGAASRILPAAANHMRVILRHVGGGLGAGAAGLSSAHPRASGPLGYQSAVTWVVIRRRGAFSSRRSSTRRSGAEAGATIRLWKAWDTGSG